MIKLTNLNKYYYKGETREIHVVNDVSLELPDKGLVTIFGTSGSGKTTLLNIIGGLDKYASGSIQYDDKIFKHYSKKEIDALRSKNIGYVFQNYFLIPSLSVYDNLKLALEIIDIFDPKEQKKRIEMALNSVGMYKFHKKKIKNLSGGQMQRISIARALIKKSKLIIADEPTGNIDSENTIEVMNLLKDISKEILVVLVTHEERIANFYSDRIIRMEDGKIVSDLVEFDHNELTNDHAGNKIYLKDLKEESFNVNDNVNIKLYTDNSINAQNIELYINNNTIYIKSNVNVINVNETKVNIVDESYDDHKVEAIREVNFDFDDYNDDVVKQSKFKFLSNLKNAFHEVFISKASSILLLILFFFVGIFMAIATINLASALETDESTIFNHQDGYVIYPNTQKLVSDRVSVDQEIYNKAILEGKIKNIYNIRMMSSSSFSKQLNFVRSDIIRLDLWNYATYPDQLMVGSYDDGEGIILGKKAADDIINYYKGKLKYQDLIGCSINDLKITGISNDNFNGYYTNPYQNVIRQEVIIYDNYLPIAALYDNLKDYIALDQGVEPTNKYEILVSNQEMQLHKRHLGDFININGNNYTIVGTYNFIKTYYEYSILTNDKDITSICFDGINKNYKMSNGLIVSYISENDYDLVDGRKPANTKEVVVNINSRFNIGDHLENGYIVVGTYKVKDKYNSITRFDCNNAICGLKDFFSLSESYYYLYDSFEVFDASSEDKDYFDSLGYSLVKYQDFTKQVQISANFESRIRNFIFFVIIIIIVIIYTYFTNRSKLMNEIYQIGIYRCLGKSNKTMYHNNISYNLVKTTFSALIGYVLAGVIYIYVRNSITALMADISNMSIIILGCGIIVLYLINLLFGILPLHSLIKKTPAEIMSKYDI